MNHAKRSNGATYASTTRYYKLLEKGIVSFSNNIERVGQESGIKRKMIYNDLMDLATLPLS